MTTRQAEVTDRGEAQATIGFFERWLTVWVFLCICVGIAIGQLLPGPIKFIGSLEVAKVNIPVGIFGSGS